MAQQEEIHIDKMIQVHRTPMDLYTLWSNPEHLPQILDFLEEVMALDDQRSVWTVVIAHNERVTWETEITETITGQLLRWHSEGTSEVLHDGIVTFTGTGEHKTATLHLQLNFYFPPMMDTSPDMLGEDIENRIEEDLQRFKLAVEAGEFPNKKREGRRGLPWGFPGAAPNMGHHFPTDE